MIAAQQSGSLGPPAEGGWTKSSRGNLGVAPFAHRQLSLLPRAGMSRASRQNHRRLAARNCLSRGPCLWSPNIPLAFAWHNAMSLLNQSTTSDHAIHLSKGENMLRKVLSLIALAILVPSANGTLLGSGSIEYGFGYAQLPTFWWGAPVETNVTVVLAGPSGFAPLASQNFAVGSPNFSTTFSSGPTFDALSLLLTDGQDDSMSWSMLNYAGGVSTGTIESMFFAGSPNLANGIDFAGSSIDHVDFAIVNLSESPGANPNGDEIWTDWRFNISMNVYGSPTIPEPASIALALIGLGGLVSIRRFTRSTNRG